MPNLNSTLPPELKDFELPIKKSPEQQPLKEVEPVKIEKFREDISQKIKEVELPRTITEGKSGETVSRPPLVKTIAYKQLPHYQEVEKILESGLEGMFIKLPPAKKQEFKIQGEQAAKQITQLLNTTSLKIIEFSRRVFKLIISWLKIIPGVNKFFIEQEAKLKADQIVALKEKT